MRGDHANLHGCPDYHITCRDEWRQEDQLKASLRRHVALGSGFVPDCSKLISNETRVAKLEKRGEVMICSIRC